HPGIHELAEGGVQPAPRDAAALGRAEREPSSDGAAEHWHPRAEGLDAAQADVDARAVVHKLVTSRPFGLNSRALSATAQETALTGVNHVVIAVRSVKDAAAQWERLLGVEARNLFEGSALRMRRCQIDVGDAYFALCEPLDEQSVFHGFL